MGTLKSVFSEGGFTFPQLLGPFLIAVVYPAGASRVNITTLMDKSGSSGQSLGPGQRKNLDIKEVIWVNGALRNSMNGK